MIHVSRVFTLQLTEPYSVSARTAHVKLIENILIVHSLVRQFVQFVGSIVLLLFVLFF